MIFYGKTNGGLSLGFETKTLQQLQFCTTGFVM